MAKIVSIKAEVAVLRGLCSKEKSISGTLLSMIDESYFSHPISKQTFFTIKTIIENSGEAPSYSNLINDPEVSKEIKEFISQGQDVINTTENARKAVGILNKYRQLRGLFDLAKNISEQLEQDNKGIQLDNLLEKTAQDISIIRSNKSTKDSFLNFGKGNNSKKFVHSLLFDDQTDALIPTGYEAFDSVSGGLPRQGLVTIGANSGMGKSLLAGDLAIKMASKGYKVVIVPLEMSKQEMTYRIMANVCDVHLSSLIQGKLSQEEKETCQNKYLEWTKELKDLGGRLTVFKPNEDVDIGEIFAAVTSLNPDVCIVDYISLLKGLDGDDQWLRLGAIARQAKINADNEKRVNILLCQVNEDGSIRYAKSISEHCVVGSTLIDTDHGKIRIDSLLPPVPQDSEPFSKSVRGIKVFIKGKYREVSHVHYNGIREVYKVVLKNGSKITCTASHKFLAKGKKGVEWIALGNLKENDLLTVSNGKLVAIETIKSVGQHPVFDITVPKVNAYIANDIICHNSNVSWIWTGNQETKESGIIKIDQPKSRNAQAFPFLLKFNYAKMRVEDIPQDSLDMEVSNKRRRPEKDLTSDI